MGYSWASSSTFQFFPDFTAALIFSLQRIFKERKKHFNGGFFWVIPPPLSSRWVGSFIRGKLWRIMELLMWPGWRQVVYHSCARWQGGGRENILYDRRLASQISHDRCSITIEQRGEKKIQSTHPFSLPTGCSLYIRQPTLLPFFYTGNKENLQTIVSAAAPTRGAGNNESDPFTFGTESRARN